MQSPRIPEEETHALTYVRGARGRRQGSASSARGVHERHHVKRHKAKQRAKQSPATGIISWLLTLARGHLGASFHGPASSSTPDEIICRSCGRRYRDHDDLPWKTETPPSAQLFALYPCTSGAQNKMRPSWPCLHRISRRAPRPCSAEPPACAAVAGRGMQGRTVSLGRSFILANYVCVLEGLAKSCN